MMKKKTKINKTAEIQKYLAAHPDVGPRDVAKALEHLKISAAYVSTIKSKMKAGTSKTTAKRGRPAKVSAAQSSDMDAVVAGAVFINKCGGIDAAREALNVAEKVLAAGV